MQFISHKYSKKLIKSFTPLGLLITFVFLNKSYPGSFTVLFLFATSCLLLSKTTIAKWRGYFYSMCAILLLLGIPVKFTWHNFSQLSYVEPTGNFSYSLSAWDEVLIVATVGIFALVTSALTFEKLIGSFDELKSKILPRSYLIKKNQTKILACYILVIIAILALNLVTGICIVGITPKSLLPWPTNAAITLLIMGGGIALLSSIICWILICNSVSYFKITCIFILLGALVNIACLSRGLILTLVIPLLFVLFKSKNQAPFGIISIKATAILTGLFLFALMTSFFVVNSLRDHFYYDTQKIIPQSQNAYSRAQSFVRFAIDRWTGIEGVMAVVGFTDKSFTFFVDATLDRPVNKPAFYEKICPWPRELASKLNNNIKNFSLPGIIAFLYYSNSKTIVFFGFFILGMIGMTIEYCVTKDLGNPIFSATLGWTMATNFIMFPGVPIFQLPNIIFWIMLIITALIITRLYGLLSPVNHTNTVTSN